MISNEILSHNADICCLQVYLSCCVDKEPDSHRIEL